VSERLEVDGRLARLGEGGDAGVGRDFGCEMGRVDGRSSGVKRFIGVEVGRFGVGWKERAEGLPGAGVGSEGAKRI
jgi:hypothetical protein